MGTPAEELAKATEERSLEVVKIGMSQSKDGIILRLAIHPNEIEKALLVDPVGTRYYAVFVRAERVEEEERGFPEQDEGKKAVAVAGELCRNAEFQEYVRSLPFYDAWQDRVHPEDMKDYETLARDYVCWSCGIKSRSELAAIDRDEERRAFYRIVTEFEVANVKR